MSETTWSETASERFSALFSITEYGDINDGRGRYLRNDSNELFPHLSATGWSILDGAIIPVTCTDECRVAVAELAKGMSGPPERCGGQEPTGNHGLVINEAKKTILFTFQPGLLYKKYGFQEHKHLVIDAIFTVGKVRPIIHVDAPESVEVIFNSYDDQSVGRYCMHLINLSGFNGSSFHSPIPIDSIAVDVEWAGPTAPTEVRSLVSCTTLDFTYTNARLSFLVRNLREYEAIVIDATAVAR